MLCHRFFFWDMLIGWLGLVFRPSCVGSFREKRGHSLSCKNRSPFLWHFDTGVEVLVWYLETLALGALPHVRGSSGFVSLSSLSRLLCSLFVLGSPLVGLLNGAFRSLFLILVYLVFFFCCSALFSLETPDLRWARSSSLSSFLSLASPRPLSLADACAPSVCPLFCF